MRILHPAEELEGMGHDISVSSEPPEGKPDVIVLSKHDPINPKVAERAREMGSKVVFDICDDHFDNPKTARIYIDTVKLADRVTTVTQAHADKIRDFCGVKATVIEDPYEWDEVKPKKPTDKLFWFGMPKNWPGLMEELPKLHGYQILCIGDSTQDPRIVQWSWETMEDGFKSAGMVILPHPKPGNSPDRVVDAVRNGLYVVTHPWPEAEHLGMWHGDIKEGVEWALENPKQAKRAVSKAQEIVRKRNAPWKIAKDWEAVFKSKTEIF
jgi:hypothetical protein